MVTSPGDQFRVPSAVLQTAVTVPNVSFALTFLAVYGEPTDTVYFVLHFAELQVIKAPNETRIMDIVGRGAELTPKFNYSAPYLVADHVSGSNLEIGPSTIYNITLLPSNTSTLPPFINALESFRVLKSFQLPTDLDDGESLNDSNPISVDCGYSIKEYDLLALAQSPFFSSWCRRRHQISVQNSQELAGRSVRPPKIRLDGVRMQLLALQTRKDRLPVSARFC